MGNISSEDEGKIYLEYASSGNKEEMEKLDGFINKGKKSSALAEACEGGHMDVVLYLLENNSFLNRSQLLSVPIEIGLFPNSAIEFRKTPLYLACEKGNLEIVKELFKYLPKNKKECDEMHAEEMSGWTRFLNINKGLGYKEVTTGVSSLFSSEVVSFGGGYRELRTPVVRCAMNETWEIVGMFVDEFESGKKSGYFDVDLFLVCQNFHPKNNYSSDPVNTRSLLTCLCNAEESEQTKCILDDLIKIMNATDDNLDIFLGREGCENSLYMTEFNPLLLAVERRNNEILDKLIGSPLFTAFFDGKRLDGRNILHIAAGVKNEKLIDLLNDKRFHKFANQKDESGKFPERYTDDKDLKDIMKKIRKGIESTHNEQEEIEGEGEKDS